MIKYNGKKNCKTWKVGIYDMESSSNNSTYQINETRSKFVIKRVKWKFIQKIICVYNNFNVFSFMSSVLYIKETSYFLNEWLSRVSYYNVQFNSLYTIDNPDIH